MARRRERAVRILLAALGAALPALTARAVLAEAPRPLVRGAVAPFAHGGYVNGIAVSPDGTRIATTSVDGTLRMWDRRGALLWHQRASNGSRDLVWGAGGTLVHMRSDRLVVLDAASGRIQREAKFSSLRGPLVGAADGSRLAFGVYSDNAVRVVDATGRLLHQVALKGPGSIRSLALSPDGSRLAVAFDKQAVIVDGAGKILRGLVHAEPVTDLGFVGPARLVTATNQKSLRIWNLDSGALERELPLGTYAREVVTHAGRQLAVTHGFRTLKIWNGQALSEVAAPSPRQLAFSADGQTLALATDDYDVRLVDTRTWQVSPPVGPGRIESPSAWLVDEAGQALLLADHRGRLQRFSLASGQQQGPTIQLKDDSYSSAVKALVALPGGDLIACTRAGSAPHRLRAGGAAVLPAAAGPCLSAVALRGGRELLTLSEKGSLRRLRAADGRVLWKLELGLTVRDLVADPAGTVAAVSGDDGELAVVDLRAGRRRVFHPQPSDSVRALALSLDGKRVVASVGAEDLMVFELPSGRRLHKVRHRCDGIRGLAFHPAGRLVAAAGRHGVCLFAASDLEERTGFLAHVGGVKAVAFTRDGQRLVTVGEDGSLAVWPAPGAGALPPPLPEAAGPPERDPPRHIRARTGGSGAVARQRFCKETYEREAEELECDEDHLHDLAQVARFPALRQLSLASSGLRALAQLPALPALRALDLTATNLAFLDGLARFPGLQRLWVDWSWIRDLTPVGRLAGLRELSLAHTPVEDLAPLRGLRALEVLDLCDTRVRDLGPLLALPRLRELRLCQTPADPAALLAARPGLRVARGPTTALRGKPVYRVVVTEPGTVLHGSGNDRLGTQTGRAVWFSSPQFGDQHLVRRRRPRFIEGYHVRTSALREVAMHEVDAALLTPAPPAAEQATVDACRSQGLCNVTLASSVPAGAIWTGLIPLVPLAMPRPWRVCRRGEALEVSRPGPRWLEPGVGDLERVGSPLVLGPEDARISAGGAPATPPPCPENPGEQARNKRILGSTAPRPIMGLFLLRKEQAAQVRKEQTARARFELASRLAVQKWTYSDRWCDDAVIQSMLIHGEPTPAMTPAEARRRYWSTLVARHAMMYREYDRSGCERALSRILQARQLAARRGLQLMHFGY